MTNLHVVKENDNGQEPTQLIKKTKIKNTPFEIIETEGSIFGAFGQYKITENKSTTKEVEDELKKITWDRIIQITSIIHEMLNNSKR